MSASIKLSQPQTQRLRRLLHMEYTLAELAEEIGCQRRVIERAIAAGCPHRVDGDRVFVVGDGFAEWYRSQPEAVKAVLGPGEAYCMRCRAPRPLVGGRAAKNTPGVELVSGKCGVCGAKVNRLREAQA